MIIMGCLLVSPRLSDCVPVSVLVLMGSCVRCVRLFGYFLTYNCVLVCVLIEIYAKVHKIDWC